MKRRQVERKKIHKILDLVLEKNQGKATVFLDFYGHVNCIQVRIHTNGWSVGHAADEEYYIYNDESLGCSANTVIKALEAL